MNILNMLYTLRFSSIQNTVCFVTLTSLVSVLFTFCIQVVLKFKKIIPAPKGSYIHHQELATVLLNYHIGRLVL